MDDVGLKITVGIAAALSSAAVIVLPNGKQKDASALALFDREFKALAPQDRKVAHFHAGLKRWGDFFEYSVYPLTRKLPGAKNPILNPFRDQEGGGGGDDSE